MTTLKLAALPPVRAGVCADPDWMAGFAQHIEALGFESVVVVEHPLVIGDYTSRYPYAPSGRMPLPDDCAIPDPIDLLAFLAGVTTTLGLATGVLVLPAHHPVVMAKRLATVDRLSKGRVRLCIGVGWMREELEACGVDFASRGRRTDECIDVMRALWADTEPEGASFEGEFFRFSHAHTHPKPFRARRRAHPHRRAQPARPSGGRRGAATAGSHSGCGATSSPARWRACTKRPRRRAADRDALELTISALATPGDARDPRQARPTWASTAWW